VLSLKSVKLSLDAKAANNTLEDLRARLEVIKNGAKGNVKIATAEEVRTLKQIETLVDEVRRKISIRGRASINAEGVIAKLKVLREEARITREELQRIGGVNLSGLGTQISSVVSNLRAIHVALAALGTAFVGGAITKVGADFEMLRLKLTQVLGSAEKTEQILQELFKAASKAPVSVEALANAFVKLKFVGLEPTIESLSSLAQAVVLFGEALTTLRWQ